MTRFLIGASALASIVCGLLATEASASDLARCRPHYRHHMAVRRGPPPVVYGRQEPQQATGATNYEDNGRYDGADLPPPHTRHLAYGQPPSWLDGYGTRPVTYGAYGTYNVYGGSAQVMPLGLPPAGGLAVYVPGAYGPGPSIIHVPDGY